MLNNLADVKLSKEKKRIHEYPLLALLTILYFLANKSISLMNMQL